MKSEKLVGIEGFDISKSALLKSSKQVTVEIKFIHVDYKSVLPFKPSERVKLRDDFRHRIINKFIKNHIKNSFKRIKRGKNTFAIQTIYSGKDLAGILKLKEVKRIFILEIYGLKKKRVKKNNNEKVFGVKCNIKIQFEGFKSGRQMIDESIYLVRAKDFESAEKIFEKEFKKFEKVYFNTDMVLVKISLGEVVDIFETLLDDYSGMFKVEEVYSRYRYRKMKPEDVWDPLKTKEVIKF